jgi:hypothetical protein
MFGKYYIINLRFTLNSYLFATRYRLDFQTNFTNAAGFPISPKLKASFIISSARLWSLKLTHL